MNSITTGTDNVAIGKNALDSLTQGNYNVAIGTDSCQALVLANKTYNTVVGYKAGSGNVCNFGSNNLFGAYAGKNITSRSGICAFGKNSILCGTGGCGYFNCGFGGETLKSMNNLSCQNNCAFGQGSLQKCGAGSNASSNNSCFGHLSGQQITSGDNNVLIGNSAGLSTSPSGEITAGNNRICLGDSNIAYFYAQVALTVVSDARDKTDIKPLEVGLDFIKKLEPKSYYMNDRNKYTTRETDEDGNTKLVHLENDGSKKDTRVSIGLLAQDVMALQGDGECCELVAHEIHQDKLGIQYERLIPILINAIKELDCKHCALLEKLKKEGINCE